MLVKQIARHLHLGKPYSAIEKAILAKLRKKTGYTFTNCKKALEMHGNDIGKVNKLISIQCIFINDILGGILVKRASAAIRLGESDKIRRTESCTRPYCYNN